MRPKVYIETSIVSYLAAKPSGDVRVTANRDATIEWWKVRGPAFELFISEFVLVESALGDSAAAKRRLEAIEGIPKLEATEAVRVLGQTLVSEGAVPAKSEIDAYHIAIAAVHGMEYLLTWNCTHIANAVMRATIESVCRRSGYEPSIICTPQELMEG